MCSMNKQVEKKITKLCEKLRKELVTVMDDLIILKKAIKSLPNEDRPEMIDGYNQILGSLSEFTRINQLGIKESNSKDYVT